MSDLTIERSTFKNIDFKNSSFNNIILNNVKFNECDFININSFSFIGEESNCNFLNSTFKNVDFTQYEMDIPITNSTFIYDDDNSFLGNTYIMNHMANNTITVNDNDREQFQNYLETHSIDESLIPNIEYEYTVVF